MTGLPRHQQAFAHAFSAALLAVLLVATAGFTGTLPSAGVFAAELTDPQCNTVRFEAFTSGSVAALISRPFYRTGAVLNGQPVYQQERSPQYALYYDTEGSEKWVIGNGEGGLYAIGPADREPTLPDTSWLITEFIEGQSQVVNRQIDTTCSRCTIAQFRECFDMGLTCDDADGVPRCACSREYGLEEGDDGRCILSAAGTFQILNAPDDFDQDYLGDFSRNASQTSLSAVYMNPLGTIFEYLAPGYWEARDSLTATGAYVISPSRTADFAQVDHIHAFSFVHTHYRPVELEVQPQYCFPLEDCGENFGCTRPMPSSELMCVCDSGNFFSLDDEGRCAAVICPQIHITGFDVRGEANGIYVPTDAIESPDPNFPVYEHISRPGRQLFFINNRWRIGVLAESTNFAYGDLYQKNPTLTSWFQYTSENGAFSAPNATASCRACEHSDCPNNLQCIYDPMASDLVDDFECGCPEHTVLSTDPVLRCERDTEIPVCQTLTLDAMGTSLEVFEGLYFFTNHSTVDHTPIYTHQTAPFSVIQYDRDLSAWVLIDPDLSTGPRAWCHTEVGLPDPTAALCRWEYISTITGQHSLFSTQASILTCGDCNAEEESMCSDPFVCVSGECICGFNTFGPDCTPVDTICPVVEVAIPLAPHLDGAYHFSGIINDRPSYARPTPEGVVPYRIRFSSDAQQWRIINLDTISVNARVPDTSSLPYGLETTWEVYFTGPGYELTEEVRIACSLCTQTSCGEDQFCLSDTSPFLMDRESMSEDAATTTTEAPMTATTFDPRPFGLISGADEGSYCRCPAGFEFDDDLVSCVPLDACDIAVYADTIYAGRLSLLAMGAEEDGDRPAFRGDIYPAQGLDLSPVPHNLTYIDEGGIEGWLLQRSEDDAPSATQAVAWGSDARVPQAVSGFVNVPSVFRFYFGDIATVSLICDVCEEESCNPTQECRTSLSGEASCFCAPENQEFFINGEVYCHHESFANAPQFLVDAEGEVFELVYDEHVNGRFFFRSDDERRETQYIFWVPNAFGSDGAWAFGTLVSFEVATSPGPVSQVSFTSGFSVSRMCNPVQLAAQQAGVNAIDVVLEEIVANIVSENATAAAADASQGPTNITLFLSETPNYAMPRVVTHTLMPRNATASNSSSAMTSSLEEAYSNSVVRIAELFADTTYYIQAAIIEGECVNYPLFQLQHTLPTARPSTYPPNLRPTRVTQTSITILFDELSRLESNGDVLGYVVRYYSEEEPSQVRSPVFLTTNVTLDVLHPAYTYIIRVSAQTSAGTGPLTPPITVVTDEGVPDAPVIRDLFVDADGQLLAELVLPAEDERNGMITQVKFTCQNTQDTTDEFVVVRNLTMDGVYSLRADAENERFRCVASIRTSAGFGEDSVAATADSGGTGSSSGSDAGLAAGLSVFFVLLIVAVAALFLWNRRKTHPKDPFQSDLSLNPVYERHQDAFSDIYMHSSQLTIIATLGEGQFGSVALAETSSLPGQSLDVVSKVAVKYLKSTCDADERYLFMDEAARMQPLNHPHVVRLLGVSAPECPDQFIVLEHLAGGDLINHLREMRPSASSSGLSRDIQLSYCRQICDGLAYLGSVGYVHRDIAARNILMTSAGALKIGDFGLARNVDTSAYYTGSKASAKLPLRWMSPESVLMNKYTHLSDVYSFGVVMYEIFTYGDYPWAGHDDLTVLKLLRQGHHMPLDNVPQSVHYLLLECWVPVDNRPTAQEMGQLLHPKQLHAAKQAHQRGRLNTRDTIVNPRYVSVNAGEVVPDDDATNI